MKNKILVITLISLILIGIILILMLYGKSENNNFIDYLDISYIKYSIGGGFGTEVDCATKEVIIKDNGYVKFTNSYNKSVTREFQIDKDLIVELEKYINENRKVFSKKDITDDEAMDASTQYLIIKTKDGKEYKIGGYCVIDNQFKQIAEKIIGTVGKENYRKYCDDIKNNI